MATATNTNQIKTRPEFDKNDEFTGHYYYVCGHCGTDFIRRTDAKGCCP